MTQRLSPPPESASRVRRVALAVVMWLFGLSTTVLLIGMWGRAVAADGDALESSARAVLESDAVTDRVTSWIAQGIEDADDELPEEVSVAAATAVWDRAETRAVLAAAVARLVDAALAPPGTSTTVDLTEMLRPVAPIVRAELAGRGVDIDEGIVASSFDALPTIVLGTEAELTVVSAVAEARSALTRVVAVALVGMGLSAAGAVALAPERLRQLRTLAVRVVVSALTFAILLRLGAWALDPRGGRSPLAAGGSVLLASSGHVLLTTAAIGAVIGLGAAIGVRRRRRRLAV